MVLSIGIGMLVKTAQDSNKKLNMFHLDSVFLTVFYSYYSAPDDILSAVVIVTSSPGHNSSHCDQTSLILQCRLFAKAIKISHHIGFTHLSSSINLLNLVSSSLSLSVSFHTFSSSIDIEHRQSPKTKPTTCAYNTQTNHAQTHPVDP